MRSGRVVRRFSKSALLTDLLAWEQAITSAQGFHDRSGYAQLRPSPHSTTHDQLIERAVEYGRREALRQVFEAVRDGRLGIPSDPQGESSTCRP